ncbi:Ig-like domain-containing protein [Robertmurraya korlensis]|uniref:Ig-like domain-containing protein n=1 Tax=Robertmurraya korlensis TaxID=519977 RepID=UPI000826DBFD|nr:Ig-like domain-containing protein [Robertmurraya korlensis]
MRKKWLMKVSNILVVCTLLLAPFSNVVSAVSTDTGTPITTQFIPYENSEGQIIFDPTNEPGISPDEVDFTSGSDGRNEVGDKPSFYVYGDSANLYFRMRLLGDPFDRKGGFLSSVWNVDILVDETHRATVGIDGKSPHVDYLFVASPDKENVIQVTKTDSTGMAVPGTSISDAENGHHFLDFKIPISKIKEIIPDLDTSKPNVSFGFSTSKSANLRVINKDGLEAAEQGASVKLVPFGIYKPTISYADVTTYNSLTPTIKGLVTNAVDGSPVTLTIIGINYQTLVSNGEWNVTLASPQNAGTYDTKVKVINEEGNIATASKTINVGTLISIDGPSVEKVYKFPTRIGGKFVNSTGGAKKVKFMVSKVTIENNTEVFTPVPNGSFANIQSNSTTQTWEKTGLTLNPEPGTYLVQAIEDTNGTNLPTANKRFIIVNPLTIETPVIEGSKLVVKGNAEAEETVELFINNETVAYKSAIADSNGRWSVVIDRQLPTGTHTFKASTKDDYNNTVTTGTVSHDVTNITVSIANGDSTVSNDTTPTIYGKASVSNNGTVEVTIDNVLTHTVSVTNGKWRLPLGTALSEGPHTVVATAKEGSLVSASDTQTLLLDLTTTVTLTPPAEFTKTNNTFIGTGEARGVVVVQVDSGPKEIINLGEKINWSYQTGELAYGSHTITVSGMDELGNINQPNGTEAKVTHEFIIVDPTKPTAQDENTYTIKNQTKNGKLAVADQNTESLQYTLKSNGEKGAAMIDSTGNWTYQPNSEQLGEDQFIVEVTNHLGNKTEATVRIQIVELGVNINGLPDIRTDDHQPTFTGTAKKTKNSLLTVHVLKEDGTTITTQEVLMTDDGDWQFDSPILLEAGKYTIKAVIRDTELGSVFEDTKSFSVYDPSYNITLLATPEKVIADGMSRVSLKAVVTDQDMNPVANERVVFTSEQGQLVQTEALTDAYGSATVELITPDYYGQPMSRIVKATASVTNVEKNIDAEAPYFLTFVPAFVKGKVLDAITGVPIPDASIKVNKTYEDGEIFSYQGTTDAFGNYIFPVKRGNTTYDVEISARTVVDEIQVPITFTQSAQVELIQNSEIQRNAERTVSGQFLVVNRTTGAVQEITQALGNVTIVPEVENPTANIQIAPTVSGQYKVTGGEVGKTYNVRFTIQHNGDIFAGKKVEIKIPEDGQATILPILIDPYGTVTNAKTDEVIDGAEVTLYWADTERNRLAGRVADTKVELPLLEGFDPNNNQNSQFTSNTGFYAWMVFPEGDYYIVSNKEGYYSYSSLEEGRTTPVKEGEDSNVEDGIIRVGYSIVNYDFKMEPLPVKEPEVKNEAPVVTNDEVTTRKHTKVDGTAHANDAEKNPLSYTLGTDGQNGKVTVTADGAWTYEPNLDFVGDDAFTILVSDQHNQAVPLEVIVHVVKPNLIITIDSGVEDRTVDRTPLINGEAFGMLQGEVSIVIKDKDGNTIETANVPVESEKWTYQLKTELSPEEYLLEVTLEDNFYKEQTKTEQALTIVQVPLQINLTATPQSVLGDGKAEVNLKAVITDESNAPIVDEIVTFKTEIGTLKLTSVTTNEKGEATVILVAPKLTDELDSISNQITVSVHNPDKGLVDMESINLEFIPNKAPVVTDDEVTTLKNTEVTRSAKVTDKESDALTYRLGTGAKHGQVAVTNLGTWMYKPTRDYVGDDSFTLFVNDDYHSDVELTVVVHVAKPNIAITIDGGEKQTFVDRTPLLTGEVKETVEGKATIVIHDTSGEMVETVPVNIVNGKWSHQVTKELIPADYAVEVTLTDTFYNETTKDNQVVTIANLPLQIELTATPSSIVGDGKTEVLLKAVIKNSLGEPIANEKVVFDTELGTLKSTEATTNDKGEATVILVAPDLSGNLQSIVKKVTASVNNPDKGLVDSKSVNITFVPARVTGQVIDSVTKNPIPNATITIKEDFNKDGVVDFQTTVKTNSNGEYDIVVPKGNWHYKLQITTTMTIGGVEVPVTFTQDANVGQTSGTGEELKSEHTVIGQLFMKNEESGKPESITSMVPGATFEAKLVGETTSNVNVTITPEGQYIITGGEKGESYTFAITVIVKDQNGNDVILAGQKMTVTIPEDGVASIESTLIDPYGIVRDPGTLEPIEGVDMQLYWADTETNRRYGREPHTLVNLPILEDFAPNQNRNNQYTTKDGQYAWMVFADGDYYIIAKKDGYPVYDSRIEGRTVEALPGEDSYITNGIIHVGQTIVEYNMNMFSKLTEAVEEPPTVDESPTEESKPAAESPIEKETPVKEEGAAPVSSLPIKVLPKTGSPFTTWTLLMVGTALVVLGLVVRGRRKV